MTKNEIIEELLRLNNQCIMEQRDFTQSESEYYDMLDSELRKIEKEEIRRNCKVETDSNRKDGKNNMEFTNAMKDLLKKEGLVNMTDLTVETHAGNGVTDSSYVTKKHARPDNFLDQVFMDATHDNLLVQLCHVVQSASETKLLIGAEIGKMVALSELEELQVKDFETAMKTIVPQRMGIGTVVSRLMIETEAFDVASHVQRLFAKSLALTIEAEIAKN